MHQKLLLLSAYQVRVQHPSRVRPTSPSSRTTFSTVWSKPETTRTRCGCTRTVWCGHPECTSLGRALSAWRRPFGTAADISAGYARSTERQWAVCSGDAARRRMSCARGETTGNWATSSSRTAKSTLMVGPLEYWGNRKYTRFCFLFVCLYFVQFCKLFFCKLNHFYLRSVNKKICFQCKKGQLMGGGMFPNRR